jgi:hypothetical protein
MTNQMAAVTLTVVKDALSPDQGETMVRPTPEPRSRRIKLAAAAAVAPPMIGAHAKAGTGDSISTSEAPVVKIAMTAS